MSECLKSYLLLKKNHKNHLRQLKSKNKPAEKNINYNYADSISYNLIESMTKFKNNEINKNEMNLSLLSNLSLFISKGKFDEKTIKKNKNKTNIDNRKCTMENYGIYFPTKRITCLEEIKLNNINSIVNQKKHKKMVMDNTTDGITFPLNDAQKAILGIFNVKMTKTELKKLHQILSEFMYELSMKKIDNLQKQGKYPSTSEIAKIHHK